MAHKKGTRSSSVFWDPRRTDRWWKSDAAPVVIRLDQPPTCRQLAGIGETGRPDLEAGDRCPPHRQPEIRRPGTVPVAQLRVGAGANATRPSSERWDAGAECPIGATRPCGVVMPCWNWDVAECDPPFGVLHHRRRCHGETASGIICPFSHKTFNYVDNSFVYI